MSNEHPLGLGCHSQSAVSAAVTSSSAQVYSLYDASWYVLYHGRCIAQDLPACLHSTPKLSAAPFCSAGASSKPVRFLSPSVCAAMTFLEQGFPTLERLPHTAQIARKQKIRFFFESNLVRCVVGVLVRSPPSLAPSSPF